MANVPSGNPLKVYTNQTTPPNMSVDGLSIDKSYAFTGVVDAMGTQQTLYASPQSTQIIPGSKTKLPNGKNNNSQQDYWESPYDELGSKDITAIQISLKVPQSSEITFFNHLSFDFSDVPANWSVYYLDPITGAMQQLADSEGSYVGGRTIGIQGYKNRKKLGWVHIEVDTQPVGSTLIELRFDRNVKLNMRPEEVNPFAASSGYPFLLRNFNLKLNATEWNQVPATANIVTKNQLGFTESYIITQKDSSQIQVPANRTLPATSSLNYWRSAPQPVGDAVVSLYTDLGNLQTIDSIYMDPLYTGIQCNVYYSNDSAVNDVFYCSRAQSTLSQKTSSALASFNNTGQQTYERLLPTKSGVVFPATGASGIVTPSTIGINGTQSWSIGITYSPNTSMVNSSSYYTIFEQTDLSSNKTIGVYFRYNASSGKSRIMSRINGYNSTGTIVEVDKITQDSTGWPWYNIVITYDASDPANPIATTYVNNHSGVISSANHTGPLSDYPYTFQNVAITVGNNVAANAPAYGTLRDLWIRQDVASTSVMNAYFNNPRLFINANGPDNTLRGDYRAVFLSRLNDTSCQHLPNAQYYESKQWTPVPSDITLRKSTFRVPTFSARYIKLEFTNLAGRVYPIAEGAVKRKTRFFPDSVKNHFHTLESYIQNLKSGGYAALSTKGTSGFSPITNGTDLSPITGFGSAQNQVTTPFTQGELNNNSLGTGFNPAPNANTYIIDPTSSVDNLDYIHGTPNIGDTSQPVSFLKLRFTQRGTHVYKEKLIEQTWNKAYFVGLKALNFYKLNQGLQDDSEYYYDTCAVAPGSGTNGTIFTTSSTTFTWNNVTSNPSGYVASAIGNTLTTTPLSSFDTVSTIQIATMTSDWISVAPLDQATLTNLNLSYLVQGTGTLVDGTTQANTQPLQQVATFNLSTGVYSFTPITSGNVYGTTNISSSLPSGLSSSSNTLGMRCSAVARIFLPESNDGLYQLNLWGTVGGVNTLLESQTFNVPLRSWTTLQIPYSINQHVTDLQAEIIQTNTSSSETFYLTLLSAFYHPIGWSWSVNSGTTWYPITTAINNPYAFATFTTPSSSFMMRAKAYSVGANVKALLIRPHYLQNSYTSQVSIDYFSDPRTNEVGSKVAPVDHPMFKLTNNYYPDALSLTNTSINWTYG